MRHGRSFRVTFVHSMMGRDGENALSRRADKSQTGASGRVQMGRDGSLQNWDDAAIMSFTILLVMHVALLIVLGVLELTHAHVVRPLPGYWVGCLVQSWRSRFHPTLRLGIGQGGRALYCANILSTHIPGIEPDRVLFLAGLLGSQADLTHAIILYLSFLILFL